MEEMMKGKLEREADAMRHLLESRGKQIAALQERLKGEEEVNRLLIGFLPLLALAAARDGAANEAVRVTGSPDVLCISIGKNTLSSVLGGWNLKTVETQGDYRLAFEKIKQEAAEETK